MTPGPWTEMQYEQMSWHDNHVHALRIVQGQYGEGELVFDLDYIVEGLKLEEGFRFNLVPVHLRFYSVSRLRLNIDYASHNAGLAPFSIHDIERTCEQRERYVAQCWRIRINWPPGEISFEAQGFEQKAWGKVVLSSEQLLQPQSREPL